MTPPPDLIVVETVERGSDRVVNGELIAAAEAAGFQLLLTPDKNMRYQQNLEGAIEASTSAILDTHSFIVIGTCPQVPTPTHSPSR